AIVFTAQELGGTASSLFLAEYPTGNVRKIINDFNSYGTYSLGLTADGKTIATVKESVFANLWTIPNQPGAVGEAITHGDEQRGLWGIDWIDDDHVVYVSPESGKSNLWTA